MSNSTTTYPPGYLEEYKGWQLKAIAISFLVLDCLFVGLRFWARYLQGRRFSTFKIDDWLMVPALIFCLGTQIIAFIAVDQGGVGRHVEYVSQHYDMFRVWYQTCMIAVAVIYMFAAAFPKLAILSLFLQIFTDKLSRYATYATIAAIVINIIVMVPLLVYKCDPISYGWKVLLDPTLQGGWCVPVQPRLQFASLANIITDVSMFLLPIPTIVKLRTNNSTKLGLALTFGMAIAGLITSCFRFAAFFKTQAYDDGPWSSVELVGWCIVEPGIYMFVASQMAFRPLVLAFMHTRVGRMLGHRVKGFLSVPVTRYKASQNDTRPSEEKTLDPRGGDAMGQNLYQTRVEAESNPGYPSAPTSAYNSSIWISHEYQVEDLPAPTRQDAENYGVAH